MAIVIETWKGFPGLKTWLFLVAMFPVGLYGLFHVIRAEYYLSTISELLVLLSCRNIFVCCNIQQNAIVILMSGVPTVSLRFVLLWGLCLSSFLFKPSWRSASRCITFKSYTQMFRWKWSVIIVTWPLCVWLQFSLRGAMRQGWADALTSTAKAHTSFQTERTHLLKQQVNKRIWVKDLWRNGKGHLIYLILLYIFLH